jgi:SPP1 gp7 family putative phage head morphogenesis protein
LDRDRPGVSKPRKALRNVLIARFAVWRTSVVARVHLLVKDEHTEDLVARLTAMINAGQLVLLLDEVRPLLEEIAKEGGAAALAQIEFADDESIVNLVNERAVEYAAERSAEMVGKRVDEFGDLIDNPNAEWQIDDATREALRSDVETAIEEGWSNDRLADAIATNYAFSDDRAEVIARTETAYADIAGNMAAYRASGQVEQKEWSTAPDACDDCVELDGVTVDLDEDFPGDGGDGPPLHPDCRCDVLPVLTDESED